MVHVGMALYGDVRQDVRVRRAVSTLVEAGHDVTVGVLAGQPLEPEFDVDGAHVVPVWPSGRHLVRPGDGSHLGATGGRARARRVRSVTARAGWLIGYGRALRAWRSGMVAAMPRADIWIGHDLFGLWVARSLGQRDGAALVYDSHELFVETENASRLPRLGRAALARLEAGLVHRADSVITVNQSIAAELRARYGVDAHVIMNVPRAWRATGRDLLRQELPVGRRSVVMYHGALQADRGIEELVEVAAIQPEDRVVVILGNGPLLPGLQAAADTDRLRGRLLVHPAVPWDELPDWVSGADLGVVVFRPTCRNNYYGTPNKLFEYLESGVPVVAGNFPEIGRLVAQVDGGTTCEPGNPRALLEAIDRVLGLWSSERDVRRARLAADASREFAWQPQADRLTGIVERLGHRPG